MEEVKKLRDSTGVSIMQCKKALEEAEGDMEKAKTTLRERAATDAAKKGDRAFGAVCSAAYIHQGGKVGALVQLACETDFVAQNLEFVALANGIAMHVAGMSPETTEELLQQEYLQDPSKKVSELINDAVQKFGENTQIVKFVRYA